MFMSSLDIAVEGSTVLNMFFFLPYMALVQQCRVVGHPSEC
jgi:hypothetical protein